MKLLVHGKADINMADGKSGKTPLHHVVEVDELSIAAYLILQVIYWSIVPRLFKEKVSGHSIRLSVHTSFPPPSSTLQASPHVKII